MLRGGYRGYYELLVFGLFIESFWLWGIVRLIRVFFVVSGFLMFECKFVVLILEDGSLLRVL